MKMHRHRNPQDCIRPRPAYTGLGITKVEMQSRIQRSALVEERRNGLLVLIWAGRIPRFCDAFLRFLEFGVSGWYAFGCV